MKILDAYLFRAVISGSALALLVLGLLDWLFGFLTQLNHAGAGGGGLHRLLLLSLYTEPARLYELFPSAVLIGALLSLGNMAANSELIAMRAAGVSIGGVIRATLRAGVLLVLLAMAFGEWVVPLGERLAQASELQARAGSAVIAAGQNVWARDGNRFIHVAHVLGAHHLRGITIYSATPGDRLDAIIRAGQADYAQGHWILKQVAVTRFGHEAIRTEHPASLIEHTLIDPKLFSFLNTRPQDMSAVELYRYIAYLRANHLDAARYALAFWQRFTTPASALVMLVLAVPFVFGSLRSGGMGQRLFVGVIVGVGFYFANQLINRIGLIYGAPPVLSAFIPLLLVAMISVLALRWVR